MEKCKFCKYSDIVPVSLFDSEVQKCKTCNFIVLKCEKVYGLIKLIAFMRNIGGFRGSLCSAGVMSEIGREKYRMFTDMLDFNELMKHAKRDDDTGIKCNMCKDPLIRYESDSGLSFYRCDYCGCVYVEYDEFKAYVDSVEREVEDSFRVRAKVMQAIEKVGKFFKGLFGGRDVKK